MSEELPYQRMPGCGMAAYVGLLAMFGLVGIAGISMSTLSILMSSDEQPFELRPGSQVATWRLQPMRDAGVLALTEVPAGYHDHSRWKDGTAACALTHDRLVAVEAGTGSAIPYAAIEQVEPEGSESTGMTVTVHGAGAVIHCHFGPREGGGRFHRQILAEAERARPGDGP